MKQNLTILYCVLQFSYWAAAMGALVPNLIQGLSGVIIAVVLMPLMKRIKK